MSKTKIYYSYFLNTKFIWILLLLCVYSVFACEFESMRIPIFSIDCDITTVDKINRIIENLSFSYVAGVVFFFLADTIPFLRRKKVAYKNVEKTLSSIIDSIDVFSKFVNNKQWGADTDAIIVFEEYSGGEFSEDMPPVKVQPPMLISMDNLARKLNNGISFVLSQELYLDPIIIADMEKIIHKETLFFISSISDRKENGMYIEATLLVKIFDDIIAIKKTIKKYI